MRIGEVSRRSGVSARMLRHYESLGLLAPSERTSSGYRDYSAADIGRIFHIEGLRKLGMSLSDVGTVLDEPSFGAGELVTRLIAATRSRIAAEQTLLDHLERIDRVGLTDGDGLLAAIDLMRSLESRDAIQRHKAALGVGVDGGVPVETLVAAVLDESVLNVAGAMRWALAQSAPEAVPHLIGGLDSADPAVRRNAVRALDEIARTTSADDLGTVIADDLVAALRSGLGDDDSQVRTLATLALGRQRDPIVASALMDMAMGGDTDVEAAELLGGYYGEDSHDSRSAPGSVTGWILVELHERSESHDPHERFQVLQVLLEIPGPLSDGLIARLSEDIDPRIAATAAAGLRRRRTQ